MYVPGPMDTVDNLARQEILKSGEIQVTGRLIDASNATLFARAIAGENEVACIYKPIAGERPLWDFPDGSLAAREFAAYLISEEGKFNVVPFTILRDGPFGPGMIQEWIDLDESIDLMEFFSLDHPRLRAMALFDAVVNNTDRKIGHLLPTPGGLVLGCDHGVTFHVEDKLRTVLWQWSDHPLFPEEIELLKDLLSRIATDLLPNLGELITTQEIAALSMRIERLIKSGTFPAPSNEWPAVPWPAY